MKGVTALTCYAHRNSAKGTQEQGGQKLAWVEPRGGGGGCGRGANVVPGMSQVRKRGCIAAWCQCNTGWMWAVNTFMAVCYGCCLCSDAPRLLQLWARTCQSSLHSSPSASPAQKQSCFSLQTECLEHMQHNVHFRISLPLQV